MGKCGSFNLAAGFDFVERIVNRRDAETRRKFLTRKIKTKNTENTDLKILFTKQKIFKSLCVSASLR